MKILSTILLVLFLAIALTPPAKGQTIAGGYGHSLSICTDSTVKAWGWNNYGQLGDSNDIDRLTPIQVSGLSGVVAVAGGNWHSMALKSDGKVWAWGYNAYGQLGDGTRTNRSIPVEVSGLSNVIAIDGGYFHSIALKSDSTVWAWGYNNSGQLGDGSMTDSSIPVEVSGLSGIVAVAAGNVHSLALRSDGTVWAWGTNNYGQLGDNTTTTRYSPVRVSGLSGVVTLTGGESHSLALKSDGTVWAWGGNYYGQLGDSTTTTKLIPIQISALSSIVAVASGFGHSLALKSDSTLWAWGDNSYGQLGDSTFTEKLTPVQVSGLSCVAIAAGTFHSLGLQSDSTVWAWGGNYYGQLGDGTKTPRLTPIQTTGLCTVLQPDPKLAFNTIKGTYFIDYNQNAVQDNGEPGMASTKVNSIHDSYTSTLFTNQQGKFDVLAGIDSVLTFPQSIPYYTYSPAQHLSVFNSYGNTDSVDFAFVPIDTLIQDLRITIIPMNPARQGREVVYRIVYKNVGTKTMSGSVNLTMQSGLTYVSANPAYSSLNFSVVEWTYSNLAPYETRSIDVTLLVPISAAIGSQLLPRAEIQPIVTDTVPQDNRFTLEHEVTGSFDPNDKTMLQGDDITTQEVADGVYMDYLIRFQNTGNDTAFKIVIRDTLDSKLVWNSLEMVSASHDYSLSARDGKYLTWTFNNILLPDSTTDEPGSHGYVCYRIQPKNILEPGEQIRNTAYIYFDYNAPVATNTSITTVSTVTGLSEAALSSGISIYPNPAGNELTIDNGQLIITNLGIYNTLGQCIPLSIIHYPLSIQINVSSLSPGIYFLQLDTEQGRMVGRFVKE